MNKEKIDYFRKERVRAHEAVVAYPKGVSKTDYWYNMGIFESLDQMLTELGYPLKKEELV